MAAHVVNVVSALTERLPQAFRRAHLRTIRRWFFAVPGDIYLGSGTLIVLLHPNRLRTTWEDLISWTNRRRIRVPWLEDRRLVLSMNAEKLQADQEIPFDPDQIRSSVWC